MFSLLAKLSIQYGALVDGATFHIRPNPSTKKDSLKDLCVRIDTDRPPECRVTADVRGVCVGVL